MKLFMLRSLYLRINFSSLNRTCQRNNRRLVNYDDVETQKRHENSTDYTNISYCRYLAVRKVKYLNVDVVIILIK